jgi:hypothetical protein
MLLTGLALLAVALFGGAALEILGNKAIKNLNIILAFGGSYIMGLLFLHLVPEAYAFSSTVTVAGVFVLVGFLVQILLEHISMGLEHGHVHLDGHCTDHEHPKVLPWAAIISLCVHALLESMPLAEGAGLEHHVHTMGHVHVHPSMAISSPLFLGLALHKLPVALVLMGLMKSTGTNVLIRWGMLIMFGLMPLLGMWGYDAIMHSSIKLPGGAGAFMAAVHGLVIGILLHVATTVLFETGEGHRFNLKKLCSVIIGLAIAYITLV